MTRFMINKNLLKPFYENEEVTQEKVRDEIKQLLSTKKSLTDYRKNRIFYNPQDRYLYFYIGGRKYILYEEEILPAGKGSVVVRTKFD